MDLRANTAVDVLIGPFVDSTDGNTTEEGLTIEDEHVLLSKLGQALTAKTDANDATHDDLGYYNCPLDATDTNTEGTLVLCVHMAGALPVRHEFNVLSEAAWDSLYAAKDVGFMDVNIKTVGRADAQETEADNLESACSNYSVTRGLTGTALPAAVANAAGGLPISAAGALALDTQLANTNEVTAARMGALTDWINGGRLDLILDIIAADTTTDIPALIATAQADLDKLTGADGATLASAQGNYAPNTVVPDVAGTAPTVAEIQAEMEENGASILDTLQDRVTAAVALASVCTEGRLAELDAGNLPTDIAAIPTTAMRGTDGANTTVPDAAGVAPTAVENRQEMDSNSTELAKIGTIPALDAAGQTIGAAIAKLADDNGGADFDATTDSMQAIRDRGDAAWITGAGGDATEAKQDSLIAAVITNAAGADVAADIIALKAVADAIPTTAMRGTDGANTTVPDAAGVAPTAVENRQEMDSNSTELAKIGTIPALDGAGQTIGAAIAKLADDNGGADFDAGTDSLQEIRDRGDAAWITGGGGGGGDATEAKQDTIIGHVDGLGGNAMRGTDGANTTVPDAAGVAATEAEVVAALVAIHLDHLLAVAYDPAAKPGVADALLNELVENNAGVSRYTAPALAQAPSGAGLTATQDTNLTFIKNVAEGDATIDKTGTPWDLVIKIKGTATELVRKELKDTDGNDLASTATVIGQQVEP